MKEQLPNSIRRELASSGPVGAHADADQLTGFAEGTLTKREREAVMQHLANCTECRDAIALATNAAPTPTPLSTPAEERTFTASLRTWLPWAATTAGVVVISSAVFLHQSSMRQEQPKSANQISTYSIPPQTQNPPATQMPSLKEDEDATAFAARSRNSGDQRLQNRPLTTEKHKIADADKTVLPPPPPAPSAAAARPQEAWTRADMQMEAKGSQRVAANQASPSAVGGVVGGIVNTAPTARKAEQAYGTRNAPSESNSYGDNQPLRKMAASAAAIRPHWRIDEQGHLQRSFGTDNWQTVLVNESARIHVVSVVGTRVWVGGENLRLYVSDDNGSSWKVVALPEKNGIAQTITQIHFDTNQVGSIESDKGTVWTTSDGGIGWK